jgi:predicted SnoaL-like aldol condensation-catalyzing enzyme
MNCILLSGGLFQIYSNFKENYLSYEDIANKLIQKFSKENSNTAEIFKKYQNIKTKVNNIKETKEIFNKELNININNNSFNLFEDQKNNFETINLELFNSFIKEFKQVYFNYENLLYLLFDLNIFELLSIETENITLCLEINNIIKAKNIEHKTIIVFDTKLENLLCYHSLGCFTVYLSHLVKMDLLNDDQIKYIDKYNEDNLAILNQNGIFFDFSVTFMVQIINYIKYIENYNEELKQYKGKTLTEKIKNKTGAYNILLIYRFFFKKGEIKRTNFFISNDKIIYTTYIGDNKKNCYFYFNKFYISNEFQKPNGIISKLSSKICLNEYGQLINDLIKIKQENPEIFFYNNPENTFAYLNRGLQIEMINRFIKECLKNNEKIFLPKSKEEEYTKIDTYETFKKLMDDNNIKFPLMLKFSGETEKYDHLIINIVCDSGLKNFIDYFSDYTKNDKKEKIKIVLQQFINHGGYIIKLYRIANKSYFFYRPSFPDSKIEFINKYPEYKRGFLELSTNKLVSKEYKTFWQKVNGINDNYNKNVDENILSKIGEKFQKFSGDSLIGLDFLLDIENIKDKKYYLIDVNQFPGYKELNKDMGDILKEHIMHYFNSK